jgi:hypothetical protein
LIVLLILLSLLGCSNLEHLDLDPKWAPLDEIHERPDMLGFSSTTTTIGHTVYVADLDRWLLEHPVGSPLFDAVLLHEQVHAVRQLEHGVSFWIARYLTDAEFMWDEEQRGWYVELRHLRYRGLQVDVGGVARNLHHYENLLGQQMVSYEDAVVWVQAVLDGSWEPAD